MKEMSSKGVRSGRLACSLLLITSLLLILFNHCYKRSYAMPIQAAEAETIQETASFEETEIIEETETIEETYTFEETVILNNLAECTTVTIQEECAVLAGPKKTLQEAEKTVYNIPSSFVHPVSGKTVSYKGGKTIERSAKITYGRAGYINAMASPDGDGFMKLDDRFLIAVGSGFGTVPGQYIDLVLGNGVVIKCIMGDEKADVDTDSTNIFTYRSCCCSEFIIDQNSIRSDIYERGNASLKSYTWGSPVVKVIVYDYHYES